MKKQVFGRRLKRDKNERKALFKGLMSSLVLHGRIKTTEEKAKAIKGHIEKLTTKAKKGKDVANSLQEFLTPDGIKKLINEIAPVFNKRPGGYTRIIRLGKRFNDNASLVLLEWVEDVTVKSSKLKVKSEEKAVEAEDVEKTVEVTPSKSVKKVVKKENSAEKKVPVKKGRKAKEEKAK